jgi:hypothetical protein
MLLKKASAVPFENVTITEFGIGVYPTTEGFRPHAQVMRRLSKVLGWLTSNGHSFLAGNGRATREWK